MSCKLHKTVLLSLAALWCGSASADTGSLPDRIERHPGGDYSLIARGATLAGLAEALGEAADCRCRVEEKLGDRPVVLDLAPRSLERLARSLARHAGAQLSVSYRLEPLPVGRGAHPGRRVFARDLVQLEGPMPKPVEVAAEELGLPVELAEKVSGKVSLPRTARPIGEILDAMARQTRSRWVVVLTFTAIAPSTDSEAAEIDRMHRHLSELSQLSAEDRRAELTEELKTLERLPAEGRNAGVRRLATDILSLGKLFQRVPGEHRVTVAAQVFPLARDYQQVLTGLPLSKQRSFQPLLGALHELDHLLRTAR